MRPGIGRAIGRALEEMPDSFELKKFLVRHRAEVKDMYLTEYNEEETMQMFEEEGREGTGLSVEQSAMLLYPLIQNCSISHGRAAEILGVRKRNLIEFYDKMGMPYLNQPREELDAEIAGFAKLRGKRAV